jgi:hypothetical protein
MSVCVYVRKIERETERQGKEEREREIGEKEREIGEKES